jgi:N-acetylmuramoyl-L-alanine amidase
VVDLSRAPGQITTSLTAGTLVVNVGGSVAPPGGSTTAVGTLEVDNVKTAQASYRPPSARLTLRLRNHAGFEVSKLAPDGDMGDRLVIDLLRGTGGEGPPLVCLDPGHGGSDTGAIGVTGLKEKDANLAIALEADKFLRQAGVATLMTRTGDTYPTLAERAQMANDANANLFVSIHNNASSDSASKGTETFYQGTPEDYSVEGKKLAEAIQKRLVGALGSRDRGARTHWLSLYVLNHTVMPAALVEVGFLTNAEEEAKLRDPAYRAKAGKAIAEGILIYLGWPL